MKRQSKLVKRNYNSPISWYNLTRGDYWGKKNYCNSIAIVFGTIAVVLQ